MYLQRVEKGKIQGQFNKQHKNTTVQKKNKHRKISGCNTENYTTFYNKNIKKRNTLKFSLKQFPLDFIRCERGAVTEETAVPKSTRRPDCCVVVMMIRSVFTSEHRLRFVLLSAAVTGCFARAYSDCIGVPPGADRSDSEGNFVLLAAFLT